MRGFSARRLTLEEINGLRSGEFFIFGTTGSLSGPEQQDQKDRHNSDVSDHIRGA
jgi:hypothetical protein